MNKYQKLYSDVLRTILTLHDKKLISATSKRKCPSSNENAIKLSNRFEILKQSESHPCNTENDRNYLGKTYLKQSNTLKMCVWNAQSLRQKTQTVKDYRDEHDLDIFLFTETWLKDDDRVEIGELEQNGECFFLSSPRVGRPGGGVGCIVRSGIQAIKKDHMKTKTFEHMEIQIQQDGKIVTVLLVYRPEPSNKNKYSLVEFFQEFTKFLGYYQTMNNEIVITGDFNFHMNKPEDSKVIQFTNILEMFDLVQHVSTPTHKDGNILDLVITQEKSALSNCIVSDLLSDHNSILFDFPMKRAKQPKKKISFRKTRKINLHDFKKDIDRHLSGSGLEQKNLNELVELYNSTKQVLDKHAPVTTREITLRKPTPFNNADIKNNKAAKRKAERLWRRTRLVNDWESFKEKRNSLNQQLSQLRSEDLRSKIEDSKGNAKKLFKLLNSSLNRKQELPLPPHTDEIDLANDFNTFFDEKIKTIRSKLDSTINETPNDDENASQMLRNFKKLSESEIKKLITEMPVKHCQLDPIPTWLLLECIDEYLPIITNIVNESLTQGQMPLELKHALVKPLLKKSGLDLIKKNYRPVSNLSFLSKLIESAVIKQYTDHLTKNDLNDDKQSAYRKFHSTETLLMKIHDDIMLNMSKGEVTMLVLLDLSAAFDTIDHNILLKRLECKYGVQDSALSWFKSYISQRSQSVIINDKTSTKLPLKFGVPQGSKLGPILFNSYITPLSEVAAKNQVDDQKYADDEQLFLSFKPTFLEQRNAVEKMVKCVAEIRNFLHENKLCNNGEKTELLFIGSPHQLNKLQISSINVDNVKITAADHVRNLGVIFDKNMSMEKQINKMCRNAYFNLRNISKIRKSLDKEVCKTAVNALVTPHLDYGNGLLYGTSSHLIKKLQVAQNSAVRLIEKLKKHDSVSQHRKQLHWLPIPARIQFKLMLTTWKALNGQAPLYIQNLIQSKPKQNCNLRSNNKVLLKEPSSCNKNKFEDRAFSHAAPKLWNNLPDIVKASTTLECFKRNLKTCLFKTFYK